jgi:hypothetical protein
MGVDAFHHSRVANSPYGVTTDMRAGDGAASTWMASHHAISSRRKHGGAAKSGREGDIAAALFREGW